MKEFWNTLQLVLSAIGGWLGYFLGGCDGLLIALLICPHTRFAGHENNRYNGKEKGAFTMSEKQRKHEAPPRYDEAFKAGAVRMVTEQGRPCREVASELGICIDTLRSWLKTAGAPSPGQADRQNRDARRVRDLETENRELRKKLAEKDEVIDVLKKSVGILSKP